MLGKRRKKLQYLWGVILANLIHKLHHTNLVQAIILKFVVVVMLYTYLAKYPSALSLTPLFDLLQGDGHLRFCRDSDFEIGSLTFFYSKMSVILANDQFLVIF